MELNQAGGHQFIFKLGNNIVKPTKPSEVIFYNIVNERNERNLNKLLPFIPKYFGSYDIDKFRSMFNPTIWEEIVNKKYTEALILEDVSYISDTVDCYIIDIKLGSIHWVSDTDRQTIEDHTKRNSNSLTVSYKFRLDGYVNKDVKITKNESRYYNIHQVNQVFNVLTNLHKQSLIVWIDSLIETLKQIPLAIYGPSILIVGNVINNDVRFSLIDFTVYEDGFNQDLIEALIQFKQFIDT